MNFNSDEIEKKYYSISEVAEILQVNTSLIRFWESEFDIIKPLKNKRGERRFTPKDIQDLKMIYYLVKEKGFTLEGARDHIKNEGNHTQEKIEMIELLKKLKYFLITLRNNLE